MTSKEAITSVPKYKKVIAVSFYAGINPAPAIHFLLGYF